jgi:antitoxin Phd
VPRNASTRGPATARRTPVAPQPIAWKLEDAKAREVVRRARTEGPQRVTVRGKDGVVVIASEAMDKLLPTARTRQRLVAFLQATGIGDLDLTREHDTGRDIRL